MSTSTLRRETREADGIRSWLLSGPAGIVSWEICADGAFAPIGVHSPVERPEAPDRIGRCPFLETCYLEGDFTAGLALGEAWADADQDDAVIWAELESWYATRLAGLAVAE